VLVTGDNDDDVDKVWHIDKVWFSVVYALYNAVQC
jgi:hypothetical protein